MDYWDAAGSSASGAARTTKRHRTSLKSERLLEAILPTVPESDWLTLQGFDPIYVRACYKKMAALVIDSESLGSCERLTYVVKGTPGIGKTTLLYYLLWRCTRDDSPFTAVLFAADGLAFVATKSGAEWKNDPFDGYGNVIGEGGKAIGLLDVSPDGTVKVEAQAIVDVNRQGPCRVYGLHRLVVTASAGANLRQLIDKDRDGRAPTLLYLPVWQPDSTRLWALKVLECTDDDLDKLEPVCGLVVPRLVKFFLQRGEQRINDMIRRFIDQVAGTNSASRNSSAKDEHTMVMLQGSQELRETEEEFETPPSPGSSIGFVSETVAREVSNVIFNGESFHRVLRIIPKAAAYVFEEMVLTKMVTADGLTFGDDALRSVQFSEVSALRASRGGMKVGVLYSESRGSS